jgi:hypothetical protein
VSDKFANIADQKATLDNAKKVFLELAQGEFDGEIKVTSHGGQDDFFDREYSVSTYVSAVLIFLGVPSSHALIQNHAKVIIDKMRNKGERNYWQLYNQGLGLFQMGPKNEYWKSFKTMVLDNLRKECTMTEDGLVWDNSSIFNEINGDSDTKAMTRFWGPCGSTAMAILNLQVFFRYGSIEGSF